MSLHHPVTATAGADDELQRTKRALQLLLGCDEALTAAGSQEELLGGVCRRLVELGGFPLTVAGWAEGPGPSAIRPIAHHERRPEDLESLRRAWEVSGAEGLATRTLPVSVRGELRVFDSVRFPMRDAEGEVDAVGGFSIDVTDRTASQDALRASREELRAALAGRLQTVREEEKTRISRDLHDELGQLLAALKRDLHGIERRLEELDGAPAAAALDRAVAATALLDAWGDA